MLHRLVTKLTAKWDVKNPDRRPFKSSSGFAATLGLRHVVLSFLSTSDVLG